MLSAIDHPTNGFALHKIHHWAMDRDIIAPGPDLHWYVSKRLDPRRRNGEKEFHELAGKSILLPKDPAFHPAEVEAGEVDCLMVVTDVA
jgi:putative restriction endonuclease